MLAQERRPDALRAHACARDPRPAARRDASGTSRTLFAAIEARYLIWLAARTPMGRRRKEAGHATTDELARVLLSDLSFSLG
jgi:hypothetical protein